MACLKNINLWIIVENLLRGITSPGLIKLPGHPHMSGNHDNVSLIPDLRDCVLHCL
jgi:hypothetical protein